MCVLGKNLLLRAFEARMPPRTHSQYKDTLAFPPTDPGHDVTKLISNEQLHYGTQIPQEYVILDRWFAFESPKPLYRGDAVFQQGGVGVDCDCRVSIVTRLIEAASPIPDLGSVIRRLNSSRLLSSRFQRSGARSLVVIARTGRSTLGSCSGLSRLRHDAVPAE